MFPCFIPPMIFSCVTLNWIINGVEIEKILIFSACTIAALIPLYFPIKYIVQDTIIIDGQYIFISEAFLFKRYKKFDIKNVQLDTA